MDFQLFYKQSFPGKEIECDLATVIQLYYYITLLQYFPESEGECVNDYVTEIISDYNVIESGNCGMKFECADGTCIDAEGKNFSLFSYLHWYFTILDHRKKGPV